MSSRVSLCVVRGASAKSIKCSFADGAGGWRSNIKSLVDTACMGLESRRVSLDSVADWTWYSILWERHDAFHYCRIHVVSHHISTPTREQTEQAYKPGIYESTPANV